MLGGRRPGGYLRENAWFWRVLNEAEVEAPAAWARHHEEVVRRYLKFLKRAREAGVITHYREDELDTLAYLLIAARDYLYLYHLHRSKQNAGIPESVVRTYMQFVRSGLNAGPAATSVSDGQDARGPHGLPNPRLP